MSLPINPRDHFIELVNQASLEILSPEDAEYIQVRFGLLTGETQQLKELAVTFEQESDTIRDALRAALVTLRKRAMDAVIPGRGYTSAQQLWEMTNRFLGGENRELSGRLVQFAMDAYPNSRISWLHFALILTFYDYSKTRRYPKVLMQVDAMKALKYRRSIASPGFRPRNYPSLPPRDAESIDKSTTALKSTGYWLDAKYRYAEQDYKSLMSKRQVRQNARKEDNSVSGEFFSSKMQRTLAYESLLERDYLELLEGSTEVVWFVAQPQVILYQSEGKVHKYYPDVQVFFEDGTSMLVEVKPVLEMACWKNWHKWRGLREYCEARGLGYSITDGTTTFKDIMAAQVNRTCVERIASAIASKGKLTWSHFAPLRSELAVSNLVLARAIVADRLTLSVRPFVLSRDVPPL